MSRARIYFVYGTLRPGGRYWPNVADLVADYEPAFVDGWALWALPEGYPAMEPGDSRVFGDLLYIRAGGEARASELMDDIEGYHPDDPESLYERIAVDAKRLRALGGRAIPADTYVYNPTRLQALRVRGERVEDGDWRQYNALRKLGP